MIKQIMGTLMYSISNDKKRACKITHLLVRKYYVYAWFGAVCSYCCLPLLSQLACKILQNLVATLWPSPVETCKVNLMLKSRNTSWWNLSFVVAAGRQLASKSYKCIPFATIIPACASQLINRPIVYSLCLSSSSRISTWRIRTIIQGFRVK